MKYFSKSEHFERSVRARRKWQRSVRRSNILRENRRRGLGPQSSIVIRAPKTFSFSRNYTETVRFLREMKDATLLHGAKPRRQVRIDLVPIESMSIASAVVLAAEVQRWSEVIGQGLQPRDLSDWSPEVRRVLNGLGFFELLGNPRPDGQDETLDEDNVVVFPILSGRALTPKDVASSLDAISKTVNNFVHKTKVYEAMAEAVGNAISYAYQTSSNIDIGKRYPSPHSKWWIATCFDHKNDNVRVFVYDQGVGIPATLPLSEQWEGVVRVLKKLFTGSMYTDSELIRAAVESRQTSTGRSNQGRGLPEIVNVPNVAGGGRVRIFSGRGSIVYNFGLEIELQEFGAHIGGTLIEWTIPCGTKE